MGTGSSDSYNLARGHFTAGSISTLKFLSNLATWFNRQTDRHLAFKILDGAAMHISDEPDWLAKHFHYHAAIKVYYRWRDVDEIALEKIREACTAQISIADKAAKAFMDSQQYQGLPSHLDYKQLAIIREKAGAEEVAIELSRCAMVGAWKGDWEKRI